MLESKNYYLLDSKGINHVARKSDGKEFDLKTLYLKDTNGAITQLVVRDNLYEKAEIGKNYKIKVLLNYDGRLQINDIELAK